MYLKSLTLKGFKSFADKTTLVFDPGLTVVVGPNGSGKSNISDAILWVLGEQSAKALRGQAMEDVIFSGSSARKPVSMAEVTLVLDNSDQTLPIDFSEVAITRRMYRSGESEYLINGAPSRLMDITDILHDSGLGKETHSIISQGHLDSVLAGRPEDRRELIEEAAGISKHRRRKERSERKLRSMDENLTRVKDINRELKRQLRPLERQADKARRAHAAAEELKQLSTRLAVDDLRRLQERHAGLEARRREADAAVELAQLRLDQRSDELERYQTLLEERGVFVGDLASQRHRAQDVVARLESDVRLLSEKGRSLDARAEALRRDAEASERQLAQAREEHEGVVSQLEEARAEWSALKARVDELAPQARQATEKRRALGRKISQLQSDQRSAQHTADQETVAYAKLRDQVDSAKVEDEMFQNRLEQLDESLSTCETRLDERRSRKEELSKSLSEAQAAADAAREEIGAGQDRVRIARKASSDATERLSRQRATLQALRSVDERAEKASPLVAALVAREDVSSRVECRLGDLFEAPAELEGLVERLLGEELNSLIVCSQEDAAAIADRAAGMSKTRGTVTVVARDLARTADSEVPVRGESLVGRLVVRPGAEGVVAAFLGDVRLVDDVESALAAHAADSSSTYVTASGVSVLPSGRIVVGTASDAEQGALERKRRIRSLAESLSGLEEAQRKASEDVASAEDALSGARERNASAKGDLARLRGELSSVTSEIGRLEGERRSLSSEKTQVEKKRADAATRAAKATGEIDRHREASEEAARRAQELAAELEEASGERSEASHEESKVESRLSEARLRLATVQERKNHLITREDELKRRVDTLDEGGSASRDELLVVEARRHRVAPLEERLRSLHDCAKAVLARLTDQASLAEADSDALKRTIGEAKDAVSDASSQLEGSRRQASDVKVEQGKVEVEVSHAVSAIEATGARLEEVLAMDPPEDREADEQRVEELSAELKGIGPVNEVAMDEYARLKERSDYIGEQVEDLEGARKSLSRITAAIDRKMRRQFLVVFDQVNANFGEIFRLLFPGGEAHLEMTDPEHPAETGIEIVAQPQGKRIQKMMLMSGGEKSLTALALLFAVYRTRTVPFYVFDEIEAALDDANLSRLLAAIDALRSSTQLIAISHQRRTMEDADVLYGVSMQADGVSHVVSQRLDHKGTNG